MELTLDTKERNAVLGVISLESHTSINTISLAEEHWIKFLLMFINLSMVQSCKYGAPSKDCAHYNHTGLQSLLLPMY